MTTHTQLPLLVLLADLDDVYPSDLDGYINDELDYIESLPDSDRPDEVTSDEEWEDALWQDKFAECTDEMIRSIAQEGVIRPLRLQDPTTVLPGERQRLYNGHHRLVAAREVCPPSTLVPVLYETPTDSSRIAGSPSYPERTEHTS